MGEATHVCVQSDEVVLVVLGAGAGVDAELESVDDVEVLVVAVLLDELLDEPDRLSVL